MALYLRRRSADRSRGLTALGAAVMTALGAYAGCAYARKQLGGMSGDIAGYSICMGEAAGLLSFIAMIHLIF